MQLLRPLGSTVLLVELAGLFVLVGSHLLDFSLHLRVLPAN
jgi:hypothetical protein